jgi:hypothetical protein
MAPTPAQPIKINHSVRNGVLAICLIMVFLANSLAFFYPSVTMLPVCNGPCGCADALPPTNPNEQWSCPPPPKQEQPPAPLVVLLVLGGAVLLLVQRLFEAYPVMSVLLLLGSALLAVLGWSMEWHAHRALQGYQDPGQADWSQRRVVVRANVAQVLQLMPLIVVTIACFVALHMYAGTVTYVR